MTGTWTTFYRVTIAGHDMVVQKNDGCTRTVPAAQAAREAEAARLAVDLDRELLELLVEVKT